MNKRKNLIIISFLFLLTFTISPYLIQTVPVYGDDYTDLFDTESINLKWSDYRMESNTIKLYYSEDYYLEEFIGFDVYAITKDKGYTITLTNSNPDVVDASFVYPDDTIIPPNSYFNKINSVNIKFKSPGATTLTLTLGNYTKSITLLVGCNSSVDVKSVKQVTYNSVKLTWSKANKCSGYIIQRAPVGSQNFTDVLTVNGENTLSANVIAKWNVPYTYKVIAYNLVNGTYLKSTAIGSTEDFTAINFGSSFTSVEKSGSSSLLLKWKKITGVKKYVIYRSLTESGTYSKISEITDVNTTSFADKVSKGTKYYYKIKCIYPEYTSDLSNNICGLYPLKGKVKITSQDKIKYNYFNGQYSGLWGHPEYKFYYQKGKQLYCGAYNNKNLTIYKLNSKTLKASKYKKIKLGKHEYYGGAYKGIDDNFYVAIGYSNTQQNDNKTVIKVIKYNSKWKKSSTCNIKGKSKNVFKGIRIPFNAGSCRMTMNGKTLYLTTGREMYTIEGINHQSNINFEINTSNMTYKVPSSVYCSHSFNQYAQFSNGDLYVVNHGDAYPRGVQLSILKNYGSNQETVIEKNVFKIRGSIGYNYTGLTVGGMEIGVNNVLIAGYSDPQFLKVAGVTGSSFTYAANAYVIAANKKTGKSTVKWLTHYNPKKSKVVVSEVRMVKLTDNRFAILYNTTLNKNTKFYYIVIDENGKTVYKKSYKNVVILGDSQPILFKGNIIWDQTYFKSSNSTNTVDKTFSIPAIY